MRKYFLLVLSIISLFFLQKANAHPMPNSLIFLDIQEDRVNIELRLPVQEFELAYGANPQDINQKYIQENNSSLANYILKHTKIVSKQNMLWSISVSNIALDSMRNEVNGTYKELIYKLTCVPIHQSELRQFTLQYDAIIHQVVTHFAIIKIQQDFNNGILLTEPTEIGIIQLDIASNTVLPFSINLDDGSRINGLKKMVSLGMHHIQTGIDHILFLIVILIIAPITIENKQWSGFGGFKYTVKRVLTIVTAFTFGHSFTLLIVSFFPIPKLTQSIEIAIALTILISSVHSIKPIFPSKETAITFLFGLIHGFAFASSLYSLHLIPSIKILSILGFNIGIEIMQIIVIIILLPVVFLSKFPFYRYLRIFGASCAIVASLAWIIERVSNHENMISHFLNTLVS